MIDTVILSPFTRIHFNEVEMFEFIYIQKKEEGPISNKNYLLYFNYLKIKCRLPYIKKLKAAIYWASI